MPEEKKLCFLVGPIGDPNTDVRDHADWLLEGIIQPVFEENFPGYEVARADRIAAPGMIDSQVINRLLDAPLVIADMSFQNANAFYEMGIRHLKRLPIIHMYLEGEVIPFDVKPYRAIPFSRKNPAAIREAQGRLKATAEEVIKPNFVVENPVTRARGIEQLDEHATAPIQLVFEELRATQERVRMLESSMKAQAALSAASLATLLPSLPRVTEPVSLGSLNFQNIKATDILSGNIKATDILSGNRLRGAIEPPLDLRVSSINPRTDEVSTPKTTQGKKNK